MSDEGIPSPGDAEPLEHPGAYDSLEFIPHTVTRVSDGLGYGEGSISSAEIVAGSGKPDLLAQVETALHRPDLLVRVPVDEHGGSIAGSGCADGREISPGQPDAPRPKVFGGGAVMATADLIGNRVNSRDMSVVPLKDTVHSAMDSLDDAGIDYGAHSGAAEKDSATASGCGAIDKMPDILRAAASYEDQITQTVTALSGILAVDGSAVPRISDEFQTAAIDASTYTGRAVVNTIASEQGKMVKELAGAHKEAALVINLKRGTTVDQSAVRTMLGGSADVFVMDAWHMQDIAAGLHESEADRTVGLTAQLAYSLATAAVLTKGDLPVYIVS